MREFYYEKSLVNLLIKITIVIDKANVNICIEDNGIGISSENLEKVFDMFYRATAQSSGSGLGLYIVKEALDKLKGTIAVKSDLNIGTKFIVEIPNQLNNLN